MEDREVLVFTDSEGQELELEILDYFEYDGEEYVMLIEADEEEHDHEHHDHDHDHGDDCCCDEEKNIYIMKVVVDGETEDFIPVEDEKMDELIEAIQAMYDEDYDDEDYDDFEDDDEE